MGDQNRCRLARVLSGSFCLLGLTLARPAAARLVSRKNDLESRQNNPPNRAPDFDFARWKKSHFSPLSMKKTRDGLFQQSVSPLLSIEVIFSSTHRKKAARTRRTVSVPVNWKRPHKSGLFGNSSRPVLAANRLTGNYYYMIMSRTSGSLRSR